MCSVQEGGDCHHSSGVQVVDHNGLILINIVLDDALDQYVEWPAQEDIVHRITDNVELHA